MFNAIFPQIFNLQLFESTVYRPPDKKGQLYSIHSKEGKKEQSKKEYKEQTEDKY